MGTHTLRVKGIEPIRIKFKFTLTSEKCFAFLLGLVWADRTLVNYIRAVLVRIPYISYFREHIVSYVFLMALLFSLPYMMKRINPKIVLAYLVIAAAYLANMVLFPINIEALEDNLVPFLFESLPLVFVGTSVDLKKHDRMLYRISMLSVLVRAVHLVLDPSNLVSGDMNGSYNLLPHVCMVVATALSHRNLTNIMMSLVGVFTILSFGTRGPILCLLVLLVSHMLLSHKSNKTVWALGVLAGMIILVTFFFEEVVQVLLALIEMMGMSTRVIDMLLSGDIMLSTGRDRIQTRLMEAISDNWFGYGIAGDRAIVGTYAHNILIEFWVSYGVFAGTVLFVVPIWRTAVLLIKKSRCNQIEDTLILALISSCYVKLFLSGTYLTESFLYLLIGVLFVEFRGSKNGSLLIK